MPKRRPRSLNLRPLPAQAMGASEPAAKAVVRPVHVATTFLRDPDNQYRAGLIYGRPDNATVQHGEALIAALEGAREALLFGSGMSAATAAVMALPRGAHVVASEVMYWAFRNWLVTEAPRLGITVDLVDTSDLKAVPAAVKRGKTKLDRIETPANPLWTVSDIAGIAAIAHRARAKPAAESTAATPGVTRPLVLGADL